jgi:hypothetical protein
MNDFPQELKKHLDFVLRARGRVLVTGLGLGCVVRGLYREADGWTWNLFTGRKQTNAAAPEVLIVRN